MLQASPIGKVPTLLDGDLALTESMLIHAYVRARAGAEPGPPNWRALALVGQAAGFLEGIAFQVRKMRRPEMGRAQDLPR